VREKCGAPECVNKVSGMPLCPIHWSLIPRGLKQAFREARESGADTSARIADILMFVTNERVCVCGHKLKDHGCNGQAGLEPSDECGYCNCLKFKRVSE
jgi:hypothetical protein